MGYGAQNFLQGIAALSNTILNDAVGIVQMRIQTANQLAMTKARSMQADYLLKLETGLIKPEDFESSFTDFEADLDGMVEGIEFQPARESARAGVQSMLPEMKLQYGIAMNKRHLAEVETDVMSNLEMLANDPRMSTIEKESRSIQAIADTPFDKAWRAEKFRAVAVGYGVQKIVDTGKANGYERTIAELAKDDSTPLNIKNAALSAMTKALEASDKTAIEETKVYLDSQKDNVDPDIAVSLGNFLKDKNISDQAKRSIASGFQNGNAEALYASYNREINGSINSVAGLEALKRRIMREADKDPVYGAGEVWYDRSDLQEKLLKRLDTRIEELSDTTKKSETANIDLIEAQLLQVEEDYKQQRPLADLGNNPLTYVQAFAALDKLNVDSGGKLAAKVKAAKDRISAHIPAIAKPYIEGAAKYLASGFKTDDGTKLELNEKRLEEVSRDFEEQFTAFLKVNPNPTEQQCIDFRDNFMTATFSQKFKWARDDNAQLAAGGTKYETGNIEYGSKLAEEVGKNPVMLDAIETGTGTRKATNEATRERYETHVRWLTSKVGAPGQIEFSEGIEYFKTATGMYQIQYPDKAQIVITNTKNGKVQYQSGIEAKKVQGTQSAGAFSEFYGK